MRLNKVKSLADYNVAIDRREASQREETRPHQTGKVKKGGPKYALQ